MMTEERFKETNYKMSYEEYKKCCCQRCMKEDCIHRDAYRRLPEIDGGLGLCPNLKRIVISMRDLKPGDVVHVQGIVCEIAEIAWQEPWDWREAYYLEFRDTNGIYRSWKQNFDGGYAELKGE